jgi:PAS domain S-box-containing protein
MGRRYYRQAIHGYLQVDETREMHLAFQPMPHLDPTMSSWPLTEVGQGDATALQRALKQSFEFLTLAEECAQIGIWDRDIATDTMRGTPTFFRIMGMEPHSGDVHMEAVRAVRHPEDARRVITGFEHAVARGMDNYESEYRIIRPSDGQLRWIFGRGKLIRDSNGNPVRYAGIDIDVTDRKEAEEQVRRLMHEVNHRANNLLGVVQAVVHHTLRGTPDPEDFAKRLSQRIAGLAASNALLVTGRWQGVLLDRLAQSQLTPFLDDPSRLETKGPSILLVPAASQSIGMAMHELATNATKYGALSNASGKVSISWQVSGQGASRAFKMAWREQAGPEVCSPHRTGFGSVVISQMLERSLDGKAELNFRPSGVEWLFECPAASVMDG